AAVAPPPPPPPPQRGGGGKQPPPPPPAPPLFFLAPPLPLRGGGGGGGVPGSPSFWGRPTGHFLFFLPPAREGPGAIGPRPPAELLGLRDRSPALAPAGADLVEIAPARLQRRRAELPHRSGRRHPGPLEPDRGVGRHA